MDCDPHEGVDIVGNINNLSMFQDGSVDEIYASHCLEHFSHLETPIVLTEWNRVLLPGGRLYVAVPDFERSVELYFTRGLNDWVVRFLMGDQEYKTAYHYNLFDEGRLSSLLCAAGFSDSVRVEQFPVGPENDCSNLKSNLDGFPVSLNMVATK